MLLDKHLKELRRLYGKFREGTLTTLEALNDYLFFYTDGLVIFPIPLLAGYFIDTEGGWFEDERVSFLWAIFFLLFLIKWIVLFSRTLPKYPTVLIRIYRLLGSTAFAGMFSFFVQPIFLSGLQ